MKRVMLIQHESFEVLGTLDPLLKKEGLRIRYVNFERDPTAQPSLEKYDALILMGGYMGVYEAHKYEHLKTEMKLIEEALKKNLPVLGICLGSQMIAHVLGADVRKHTNREMGWYRVELTQDGIDDPVLGHFQKSEFVFQSHGDTFEIPESACHLASSQLCRGQAFRYQSNVYGFQFHLEIDLPTIEHWLKMPENQQFFEESQFNPVKIQQDTRLHLNRSLDLSTRAFKKFLKIGGARPRTTRVTLGHQPIE